ncbi:NUDIX hydrolase [Bacillus cereus]|uniref:NUDIX hydrolase n=1 Tax=Bacillus cereus TaxID=1396 RepID=UPI00307AAAF9
MGKYQTEEEVLKNYNAKKYVTPDGYTSDISVFTIVPDEDNGKKVLKIMLIQRAELDEEGEPNIEGGKWALPGGFVQPNEDAFMAAKRELEEETGVKDIHLKHYGVYDKPGRDKRGWIISNAHYAIVPEYYLEKRKAADDAAEVELFTMEEAFNLELAFDHRKIISDALEIIKRDMMQTNLAKEFLPEEFTVSELRNVLLAVYYHKSIDSENFFKKIKNFTFITKVENKDKKTQRNSKKPANLYRFMGEEEMVSKYF